MRLDDAVDRFDEIFPANGVSAEVSRSLPSAVLGYRAGWRVHTRAPESGMTVAVGVCDVRPRHVRLMGRLLLSRLRSRTNSHDVCNVDRSTGCTLEPVQWSASDATVR